MCIEILLLRADRTPYASVMFNLSNVPDYFYLIIRYSSPVTGLEWPRGFQEVNVPRFHDNGTGRW